MRWISILRLSNSFEIDYMTVYESITKTKKNIKHMSYYDVVS